MSNKYLGIYLNDHLAVLAGGEELVNRSRLSRLVEVEGIGLALEARRSFWDTLSGVGIAEAGGRQTAELAARAKDEIVTLEEHRLEAATEALGASTSVH